MELNTLIMESIKNVITEGREKQKTSVEFGGDKGSSMKDENVEGKAQSATEEALKSDGASKEHKNPQGEAKTGLTPAQMGTNLQKAVTAGVAHAGIGAKKGASAAPSFTLPAPATK
jgi:hypothetical protein